MAGSAQATQDEFAALGGQVIQMISQNNQGSAPTQDQLASWAENYGMTSVPCLNAESVADYELDGYIPTIFIVGPDMTVLSADEMDDLGDFL